MTDNARITALLLTLSITTLGAFGAVLYTANDRQVAVKQESEQVSRLTQDPAMQDPFSDFTNPTTGLRSSLGDVLATEGESKISILNLNELATPPEVELDKDVLKDII